MVRNGNPLAYTGNILANQLTPGDRSLNRTGVTTLVAGTSLISAPDLRSDMQIFLSRKTQLGPFRGILTVIARTNGQSFRITSLDATASAEPQDVSEVNFLIVKSTE